MDQSAPGPAATIAARLRHGAVVVLPGSGHIGPMLQAAPEVASLVTAFRRDPGAVIAEHERSAEHPQS